ncbi:MAG: homoserine dehydrogenase [Desulfurococcaceae archaeon]
MKPETVARGVVLSGTPVFSLVLESLAGVDVRRIQGIVNGTTNYILTRMEEGLTYEEALREAQKLGYAEADPTLDVEGWDAAIKAVILANVIMGSSITIKDVEREGITRITTEDIKKAREEGCRIKLVAEVSKNGDNVKASVRPRKIPLTHPLANVMGVTNALTLETDHLGLLTIVGPGAGRIETGQAILSDILAIHRYISLSRV